MKNPPKSKPLCATLRSYGVKIKKSVSLVKATQNTVRKLMIDRHKIISVGAYSNDVGDAG